jgi:hypothetical protein
MATDELDLDKAIYPRRCKVSLKTSESGADFDVHCGRPKPDGCNRGPTWSFTQTVRVLGNKVTIQHAEKQGPAEDCLPARK